MVRRYVLLYTFVYCDTEIDTGNRIFRPMQHVYNIGESARTATLPSTMLRQQNKETSDLSYLMEKIDIITRHDHYVRVLRRPA